MTQTLFPISLITYLLCWITELLAPKFTTTKNLFITYKESRAKTTLQQYYFRKWYRVPSCSSPWVLSPNDWCLEVESLQRRKKKKAIRFRFFIESHVKEPHHSKSFFVKSTFCWKVVLSLDPSLIIPFINSLHWYH